VAVLETLREAVVVLALCAVMVVVETVASVALRLTMVVCPQKAGKLSIQELQPSNPQLQMHQLLLVEKTVAEHVVSVA